MYLKAIRLKGFKSFAKPVELVFEPGVAVVIGPNGSGKSNLADAVMWVLGEQSPSSIRGASMQDMIFAGSDGRRASASAEVELTFDNSDGKLSLPTPEVSVGRRVQRDGQGTYFINRAPCRLTDVIELMAEIGLGTEMHSIVSQGKVESLLAAKPADRRALIEEAAGLGRYKRRRERSEMKLREVARNLEQARLGEREAAAQLAPLRRQANAAELMRQVEDELAETRGRLLAGELEALDGRLAERRRDLATALSQRTEVQRRIDETIAARRAEDAAFARQIEEREQRAQRLLRARYGHDRLESAVRLTAQRVRLLEEVERAARGEQERLLAELTRVPVSEVASSWAEEEERLEAAVRAAERSLQEAATALGAARQQASARRAELARLQAERDHDVGRAQRLRERRDEAQRVLAESLTAVERATADLESARAAALAQSDEDGLTAELAAARAAAAEAEQRWRAAQEEAAAAERRGHALTAERATIEAEIAHVTASLRELDDVSEEVLRVAAEFPGATSLVRAVTCEPGYEAALAAALAQLPGALAVAPQVDHWSLLAALKSAGVGLARLLLPGRQRRVGVFPGAVPLLDKVSVEDELEPLLADVVVVDDVRTVPDTFAGLAVTRSGEYYRPQVGQVGLAAGVPAAVLLQQRTRLRELEKRAAELHADETREMARVEELGREAGVLEETFDELRARERAARGRADQAARDREAREARVRACEESLGRAQRTHAGAAREVAALEEEITALERRSAEASDALAAARSAADEAAAAERAAAERHEDALAAHTRARIELNERRAAVRREEEERARAVARAATARARIDELSVRLRELPQILAACRDLADALEGMQVRAAALVERLSVAANADGEADDRAAAQKLAEQEVELRQRLEALGEQRAAAQVEIAHLEERRSELAARLEAVAARLEISSFAPPENEAEAAALRSRVERLERRRASIGPVNPLAEAECAQLEERVGFLRAQVRDLEKSSADLAGLIDELNGRIDAEFRETFAVVSQHFATMCETLFPGGRGRLRIVEGDGPDDSGVEIEVKPPRKLGKKLGLLSGGERSMIAIAFLMALVLARPSPFYILDEIEAALDDINIGRFVALVRNYRTRTQFLIITHQKRTMEAADVLYGVTMGPDGTSQVVSARMAEAEIDAEQQANLEAR